MIYFFAAIGIITCITIIGALVLWIITTGEEGIVKSILYDDPDYFEHDEPKWLNDDKKADMQQDGKKGV